jgi:hypothetical protein
MWRLRAFQRSSAHTTVKAITATATINTVNQT